ncbi:MAG TPA: holo-ACP synthase [Clostridiales bacterium]|nr:holo-ACP synthase [Clostridiales bacterium]
MLVQTGIDAVELSRMEKSMQSAHFVKRILGKQEYTYYREKGFPVESIAAAWAAKEAFSKCLGTGFRGFSLSDVQVLHTPLGKPYLFLSEELQAQTEGWSLDVSLTHTKELAMAVVVAIKED